MFGILTSANPLSLSLSMGKKSKSIDPFALAEINRDLIRAAILQFQIDNFLVLPGDPTYSQSAIESDLATVGIDSVPACTFGNLNNNISFQSSPASADETGAGWTYSSVGEFFINDDAEDFTRYVPIDDYVRDLLVTIRAGITAFIAANSALPGANGVEATFISDMATVGVSPFPACPVVVGNSQVSMQTGTPTVDASGKDWVYSYTTGAIIINSGSPDNSLPPVTYSTY